MESLENYQNKQRTETAPVYFLDDGWTVIRNSKIGSCPRQIWAHWKGIEPRKAGYHEIGEKEVGEFNSNPFEEGHLHEAHIQHSMIQAGWKLDLLEAEFELVVGPRVKVIGHMDMGSAIDPATGIDYVAEIKTMNRDGFAKFVEHGLEVFPSYAIQLSTTMIAMRKPGLLIVKNRDSGNIIRQIFDEPPVDMGAIVKRVVAIKRAVEEDRMPPCSSYRNHMGGWCEFQQLHNDDPPTEKVVVEIPEMADLLKEYQQLGSTVRDMEVDGEVVREKDRRSELLEAIKQVMKDRGAGILIAGGLKITEGDSKKVFDEEQFKVDHPELWRKYRTKDRAGSFRVSKYKRKEG